MSLRAPAKTPTQLGMVDTQIATIGARLKNLAPRETRYIGSRTNLVQKLNYLAGARDAKFSA